MSSDSNICENCEEEIFMNVFCDDEVLLKMGCCCRLRDRHIDKMIQKYNNLAESCRILKVHSSDTLRVENEKLKKALHFAKAVIENYQLDIRNSEERFGVDLVEKGFCQGSIYLEAIQTINDIAEGK